MSLVITSLGMITSVGRDVVQSCASIRAGLRRPHEINYFDVLDPETQDIVPLIGHPIRGFTDGFNLVGLWIRIAKTCIADLIKQGNLPDKSDLKFWRKTAFIGVIPYINDDRFQSQGDEKPDMVKQTYLVPLLQALGLDISITNLHVVSMGHAGAISAIIHAESLVSSSDVERILVLAVDSYLDTLTLEWLAKYNRLKTNTNPIGLAPGEAGVCFLLETVSSCKRRNAQVQAVIAGVAIEKETHHFFSNELNQGVGLSKVIEQAFLNASVKNPFWGDIIVDQNGENWRARELAGARLRLSNKVSSESSFILPCVSIGDTGAASGAVSICVAVRSFMRNYSSNELTLVVSSSEHGDVGAALISKVG